MSSYSGLSFGASLGDPQAPLWMPAPLPHMKLYMHELKHEEAVSSSTCQDTSFRLYLDHGIHPHEGDLSVAREDGRRI